MTTTDELRRALAALTVRERDALLARVRQSSERWEPTSPALGAAVAAFATVIEDVARLERAKLAARVNDDRQPMRHATRGRT